MLSALVVEAAQAGAIVERVAALPRAVDDVVVVRSCQPALRSLSNQGLTAPVLAVL